MGPYVIEQQLGRGGAGDVWLAKGPQAEAVALKILRPGAMDLDAASRQRFEREGEILRRLTHPNIVALRDRGLDAELERPWLAMEYVPGRDLAAVLKGRTGNRLPTSEGLFVIEGCARALEAAHAQGIIHRDVKPGNVLLTRDGAVKLTDFGIALSRDASSRLTARGEVVGTPTYVAPEVLARSQWGPPADMYALGVLVYRLLTGQPPFPYKDLGTLISAHLREPPPPLAQRVSGIAPPLAALFERLLAKDPALRPAAGEFLRELQRITREDDTRRIPARLLQDARRESTEGPGQHPGSDDGELPTAPLPTLHKSSSGTHPGLKNGAAPSGRQARAAQRASSGAHVAGDAAPAEAAGPAIPLVVWVLVLISVALAGGALLWKALR